MSEWIIEITKIDNGNRVPMWLLMSSTSYLKLVDRAEMASRFPAEITEGILSAIRKTKEECSNPTTKAFEGIHHTNIKIVELHITTVEVDINASEHVAARKKLAVDKLSIDELEALGLENYAVHRIMSKPTPQRGRKRGQ